MNSSSVASHFSYKALNSDGELLTSSIAAPDRAAALRKLAGSNLTVLSMDDARTSDTGSFRWRKDRAASLHRQLVLRQLAVMVGAGVELLEALETVRLGLPDGATRKALVETVSRLRKGERLGNAIAVSHPDYPRYVIALIGAGEASGQLSRVLKEASDKLAAETKVRREIKSALVYPTFLVMAGILVVSFLFYVVVPRFAVMLGPSRETLTGLPNIVLSIGEMFSALGPLPLFSVILCFLGIQAMLSSRQNRHRLLPLLMWVPGARLLITTRLRAGWTRIMSFSIGAGIGFLQSLRLAAESVGPGSLREALERAMKDVRAGKPIADAMSSDGLLTPMDLSLLRVGQRTGTLDQMFATIADHHQERLLELLKRATVIVEQLAIAVVASAIGLIVISLVSAMTSVYGSIE